MSNSSRRRRRLVDLVGQQRMVRKECDSGVRRLETKSDWHAAHSSASNRRITVSQLVLRSVVASKKSLGSKGS